MARSFRMKILANRVDLEFNIRSRKRFQSEIRRFR